MTENSSVAQLSPSLFLQFYDFMFNQTYTYTLTVTAEYWVGKKKSNTISTKFLLLFY